MAKDIKGEKITAKQNTITEKKENPLRINLLEYQENIQLVQQD